MAGEGGTGGGRREERRLFLRGSNLPGARHGGVLSSSACARARLLAFGGGTIVWREDNQRGVDRRARVIYGQHLCYCYYFHYSIFADTVVRAEPEKKLNCCGRMF